MNAVHKTDEVKFEKAGRYRIQVAGHLDSKWSDRLAGMLIKTSDPEDEKPKSTLIGVLRDQAQLSGVLNSLYDLHLPLLHVEYLDAANGEG